MCNFLSLVNFKANGHLFLEKVHCGVIDVNNFLSQSLDA